MIYVSDTFNRAVFARSRQVRVRLEVLDLAMNPVSLPWAPDGDISGDYDETSSGTVEWSADNDVARTASITLANQGGKWTPEVKRALLLDRLIRLHYGLVTGWDAFGGEIIEWCPVGVFVIGDPQVDKTETGSQITMSLYDRSSLMTDPYFFADDNQPVYDTASATVGGYPAGSKVTDAISDIGMRFGFTEKWQAITPSPRTFAVDYPIAEGDDPLKAIKDMANGIGHIAFVDASGILTTRPNPITTSQHVVAEYKDVSLIPIIDMSSTFNSTGVHNAVLVLGGGDGETPLYRGYAEDTDPNSPISVDKIGKRVLLYNDGDPDSLIVDDEGAQDEAEVRLADETAYLQSVSWSQITDPRLEMYDVIYLEDSDAGVADYFSLRSFSIPFGLGTASGSVSKTRSL